MAKKKEIEETCCFIWYNHETKQPYECGKPAVYLYRDKPLCEECFKNSPLNNTAVTLIKNIDTDKKS